MALYPSQEWCDEWRKAINNDTAVREKGSNWGVGFNGNWLFEVTPGGGLEHTVYIYLDISAGECHDARMVDDPSKVDPGFHVTGSYADYKQVIKGEMDFIAGVVKRRFRLKGDVAKIMLNSRFVRAVAGTFSSFESEYLGE
ncbi:MAG: SCP2 sterol-binding domain-containing protein [Anaerolineae bacterium]|nr:SCP2 sterol-binding domain-containing protein [Anaerolineae bacterium]